MGTYMRYICEDPMNDARSKTSSMNEQWYAQQIGSDDRGDSLEQRLRVRNTQR